MSANKALLTSLSKTNNVVSTTLHTHITQHTTTQSKKNGYDASKDGLDYLHVKNGIMISYLIDLTVLLRSRLNNAATSSSDIDNSNNSNNNNDDEEEMKQCINRLHEMRTTLTKIRPLEKKLRYQIDKLLALSTLGSGTFAAVRKDEEKEEEEVDGEKNGEESDWNNGGGVEEGGLDDGVVNNGSDPLSYKPDLQGMMKMFEEDNGNEPNDDDNDSDDDDGSNVSEDDEETLSSKPKISLEKDDDDNNNTGVYQPPRLNSVPFELDNERQLVKQQRLLAKQRDKLSRSELTQVIKSQYTDAPEEEDHQLLGSQSEKSRKVSQRDANIQEFEENQMIRLTMSRSEKKERKKMRREEMSNLNVLSDGFGYAGVEDAFGEGGGGGGNDSDDGGGLYDRMSTMKRSSSGGRHSGGGGGYVGGGGKDGSYKTKGMRKRKVEVLDDSGSGSKRKSSKKKGASNTYQKSLYGGGGGGGKARKRR